MSLHVGIYSILAMRFAGRFAGRNAGGLAAALVELGRHCAAFSQILELHWSVSLT